jgi:acetyltransferase-like isoleucine patch superfamily enzyme
MSRVYVQPTGRRIAPFGDPVGEVPIANRPLSAWLHDAITDAGLERLDQLAPPCLVVPDTLLTTGHVLRQLVQRAAGQDAVLVLARSVFGERTRWLQPDLTEVPAGWRFEQVRYVSGRDQPAIDVVIDPEEDVLALKLPAALQQGPADVALPRHPVLTVHHWAHLVWASQAMAASVVRRQPRWRGLLRVLWAILRARSLNRWRVLGKLNTLGKGCDIHPTAVIEGSTLGDGVTVGSYARVLFSTLGDGAQVFPGASVEVSTLGAGAVVAQGCGVRAVVLYPEAFSSTVMLQASVLGRRAMAVPGSYLLDLNFERDIRVPLDGALQSAGTRFLGCALGHEARVGTGIWVASGRSIPNGCQIVRHPAELVSRLPEQAGGAWVPEGGGLVPLHEARDVQRR